MSNQPTQALPAEVLLRNPHFARNRNWHFVAPAREPSAAEKNERLAKDKFLKAFPEISALSGQRDLGCLLSVSATETGGIGLFIREQAGGEGDRLGPIHVNWDPKKPDIFTFVDRDKDKLNVVSAAEFGGRLQAAALPMIEKRFGGQPASLAEAKGKLGKNCASIGNCMTRALEAATTIQQALAPTRESSGHER